MENIDPKLPCEAELAPVALIVERPGVGLVLPAPKS